MQTWQTSPRVGDHRSVTIVSDEHPDRLRPFCALLAGAGVEAVVQPASSSTRARVVYVRTVDPGLDDENAFARVATLGARPACVLNVPASVRLAEWSPLATLALRERGIAQPERVWCLDESDLERVTARLGLPVVLEGVVTRRRVRVTSATVLRSALAEATGAHAERGAMAESPVHAHSAVLAMMVIDGTCIPLPGSHGQGISAAARMRAGLLARDAVAALGGSAMVVEMAIRPSDDAVVVTNIDAAPSPERLGRPAMNAVVRAIAARLARRPPQSGMYPAPPSHAPLAGHVA